MRRIGNFTPVLECTHVSATTRVRGVTAFATRRTIVSAEAAALSS
jgi:hypothetical protein